MAQAWLDSLSEDWVSQAGSDPSQSPPRQPTKATTKTGSATPSSRGSSGRLFGSVRHGQDLSPSNSSNVLSERSANEINIFGSRRGPSKLSNEYKPQDVRESQSRGRESRRSISVSSLGSVVHNTIERKPHSTSPGKAKTGDTPEWRRRLIDNNFAYGEQRDLFSAARVGLENMFDPPPAKAPGNLSVAIEEDENDEEEQEDRRGEDDDVDDDAYRAPEIANDTTMPSSPPIRSMQYDSSNLQDDAAAQQLPQQPYAQYFETSQEESAAYGQEQTGGEAEEYEEDGSVLRRDLAVSQGDAASVSYEGSQIHHPMDRESRMVSGQSVLRNESFSAIMISPEKNKGGDGAVFGPVELPPGELKRRLDNLRWNQMLLADDANQGSADPSDSTGGKSPHADNTEEYENMRGFINFRRGGRSADGSFRDRLLSPPIGNDTSEMLPEESLQASTPKQFASIRIDAGTADSRRSPQVPRAPNPSPEKRGSLSRQHQLHAAGGSPLKLFGPYDTFTNQTLMRRISQFEDQMSNGSRASADRSANFSANEPANFDTGKGSANSHQNEKTAPQQKDFSQSSAQFGAGHLDSYQFTDEQLSQLSQEQSRGDNASPDEDEALPAQSLGKASFPSIPAGQGQGELFIQRLRQSAGTMSSRPTTAEKWAEPADPAASTGKIPQLATPRRIAEIGSEAKRPRTSPSKDPTPKRRRTLHKSDIAFGFEESPAPQMALGSVQLSHSTMQAIISRKRRDARDGDELQYAGPEVLANRDILRPRTPTPSQRSSVQREQNPNASAGRKSRSYMDGHNGNMQQANHSFGSENDGDMEATAWSNNSSLPGPPGPASGPAADGERKPSIRTEDFMNEAQKILAMIRSRGAGVQGGLASVEESEMETPVVAEQSGDDDLSFQESTKEPFSRPPSREGKPVPRVARIQEDPELVARLQKYQEQSDLDDIVTATTRSINIAQNAIREEKEAAQAVQDTIGTFRGRVRLDDSDDISDPPNIRISMNPKRQQAQQHPFSFEDENPSQASQRSASSGNSTGRSIPTGSSRGSDTRRTIAPQTVSHLIPDQVGNMMLDRDRNIWIRQRNGSSGAVPNIQSIHNILPSEGSEEDPFADIPDLSVDATLEIRNLKPAVPSPVKATGPVLFTRSNIPMPNGTAQADPPAPTSGVNDDNDTVVEHEISIDEGRTAHSSSPSRKRHLAISFSSPIASIIQDFVVEDDSESRLERSGVDEPIENSTAMSSRRGRRTVSVKFKSTAGSGSGIGGSNNSTAGSSTRSGSTSRGPGRAFSLAGQAFVSRPISRIEEREEDDTNNSRSNLSMKNRELSVAGDQSELVQAMFDGPQDDFSELVSQRRASVSVVVTTPGPASRVDDEQVMAQYVGMLSLSPMSEFTIHQERSLALEASYVLGDRHLVTGDNSKAVMSQSLRGLVDRLAEVEPFEPYWEDMEELDVQGKGLESLHKLDEFCPQLVKLDAGGNVLRSLSGIPTSVRHLRLVSNQLTELTSWASLANLQYLDISNNDIKTLSGLKSLVHLRGLKADNCNLENLDGLKYHDALQTLRARGNLIESVDFNGTRLQKLVELDLENNQIATVSNLDQLLSLTSLNLRRNTLDKLTHDTIGSLPRLRTLNVSDNQLEALDVRSLPALRVLFADRNRLARIRGFSKTPRLDSVSIREQALPSESDRLDISSLYHAYEIRKLYLSGNVLGSFDPPVDFLNLQLLELANCGLTSLPAQLGHAVPNLRKVNLNFNALTDLSPLGGIPRLKKVLAAGNRLAHAFSVIQTLAAFPHLAEVDLRDNPVTQGFYPHGHASVSAVNTPTSKEVANTQDQAASASEPFTLAAAGVAQDKAYCSRLDIATGMRRRVYSKVFGDACGKLQQLDGLAVDRGLGDVRDAVWEALNAKGIVIGNKGKEEDKEDKEEEESRWGAEDTFA